MLGHQYGIQVTHARGEAGGPKLPPTVEELQPATFRSSLCRLYRAPASRPLFPRAPKLNLGLSTSCSATFWQLLVFRATFCRFLNNFSSYILILRYRSFWCLNWPFFHIHNVLVDNLWISCKKRSQIFLPCWEGFGFAGGPLACVQTITKLWLGVNQSLISSARRLAARGPRSISAALNPPTRKKPLLYPGYTFTVLLAAINSLLQIDLSLLSARTVAGNEKRLLG